MGYHIKTTPRAQREEYEESFVAWWEPTPNYAQRLRPCVEPVMPGKSTLLGHSGYPLEFQSVEAAARFIEQVKLENLFPNDILMVEAVRPKVLVPA